MGRVIVGSIASAIGVALIGAAIFSYVGEVENVSLARESNSWPSVTGSVTASELFRSGPVRTGSVTVGRADIWAKVSYRYTVQDRDYESDRITFTNLSSGSRRSQRAVDRYPVGQEVEVFYKPADPSKAVLEPGGQAGSPSFSLGLALPGLLIVVIGVGFFIQARNQKNSNLR